MLGVPNGAASYSLLAAVSLPTQAVKGEGDRELPTERGMVRA